MSSAETEKRPSIAPDDDVVGPDQLVPLDRDHPGFRDADYRARRNAIAQVALDYHRGEPVPRVHYTEREHGVWRTVLAELATLHRQYACAAYLDCTKILRLDPDRIPQLVDINPIVERLGGFRLMPVAGLVRPEVFLDHLRTGEFLSTQYMRHHSCPLYTPEPDLIHEVVGHAVTLVHPELAELNRAFGQALARGADVDRLTRVYWYSLEFGLVEESGRLRTYGAGLLSSFGELGRFEREAEIRPFDIARMAETPFDPTNYQRCLFLVPSLETMIREIRTWLANMGDEGA